MFVDLTTDEKELLATIRKRKQELLLEIQVGVYLQGMVKNIKRSGVNGLAWTIFFLSFC